MAAMSTAMSVSGSVVAAPAVKLSASAAFGSSGVQQLSAVRSPARLNASRIVAVRASQNPEEQTPVKSKVLVALVAAGAAFALNVTPVAPAHAGFFDGIKVERGATAPDFPGNEGTGNKVGNNEGTRGSANSGTPLGEGAGGNLVGDNQSTRQRSSTGTPLGEGSASGSGVNIGDALKVPDVGGIVPDVPNPLNKISELNPLKNGLPDASNIVGDAKNAAKDAKSKIGGGMGGMGGMPDAGSVVSDAKSKVSGGLPDTSSVASDAKKSAQDLAGDAKSKLGGGDNLFGSAKNLANDVANSNGAEDAKNAARGVATNSAQDLVESAKNNIGFPNPMEAGKALMNKVGGN